MRGERRARVSSGEFGGFGALFVWFWAFFGVFLCVSTCVFPALSSDGGYGSQTGPIAHRLLFITSPVFSVSPQEKVWALPESSDSGKQLKCRL